MQTGVELLSGKVVHLGIGVGIGSNHIDAANNNLIGSHLRHGVLVDSLDADGVAALGQVVDGERRCGRLAILRAVDVDVVVEHVAVILLHVAAIGRLSLEEVELGKEGVGRRVVNSKANLLAGIRRKVGRIDGPPVARNVLDVAQHYEVVGIVAARL